MMLAYSMNHISVFATVHNIGLKTSVDWVQLEGRDSNKPSPAKFLFLVYAALQTHVLPEIETDLTVTPIPTKRLVQRRSER